MKLFHFSFHSRSANGLRPSCPCALSWAGLICAGWRLIRASQLCQTCRKSTESWRSCRCLMMNLCSQTLQQCLWIAGIWVRVGQRSSPRDSADSADTGRPGPSHPPPAYGAQLPHPLHTSAARWDTAQYVLIFLNAKNVFYFFNICILHIPLLMSNSTFWVSQKYFLGLTKPIQEHVWVNTYTLLGKKSTFYIIKVTCVRGEYMQVKRFRFLIIM